MNREREAEQVERAVSGVLRLEAAVSGDAFTAPWEYRVWLPTSKGPRTSVMFRQLGPLPILRDSSDPPLVRPDVAEKIHTALGDIHPLLVSSRILLGGTSQELRDRMQLLTESAAKMKDQPLAFSTLHLADELSRQAEALRRQLPVVEEAEAVLERRGWVWDQEKRTPRERREARGRPGLLLRAVVTALAPPLGQLRGGRGPLRVALSSTLLGIFPEKYSDPRSRGLLDRSLGKL